MWFSDSFCKIIWLSLVGIMLTGCGGSSSTPSVVVDPNLAVPLQTAMANLINNGFSKSYTLSGWIDQSTSVNPNLPHTPLSGSGTVNVGVPSSVVFTSGSLTGVTALKSVVVITGSAAYTATYYLNTSNYSFLAIASGSNFYYYTPYTFPASVKAGNMGTIGSSTTGGAFGSYTTTGVYSVASDGANSLLVSFIETLKHPVGGYDITSTVYRIDKLGAITPVRIVTDKYFATQYENVVLTF